MAPPGDPRPPDPRRRALAVLAILAAGAVLRVVYLVQSADAPLVHNLLIDAANYDAWARRIVAGDWLGDGVFEANPLYPYLLAAIYAVAGAEPATARWVQSALTLAGCAALSRAAWLQLGRGAALATLALAVAYGPLIVLGGEILAEAAVVTLAAVALWLSLEAAHRAEVAGRVDAVALAAWLGAGAALGLACLGRPNLLPLVPLFVLHAALAGRPPWRRAVPSAAAVGLGAILAVAPVTVRNLAVSGEPVLITAHGGVNLWIGNNPDATGWWGVPAGSGLASTQQGLLTSARGIAEAEQGRPLAAREVSRWWSARAVEFVVTEPGAWLGLTARKVAYVLNAYEKPLVASMDHARQQAPVLRLATVGYGVVLPLAVAGVVLTWRDRRRTWLLLATVAVAAGTVVAFFVTMRYRVPVVVGLLPLAGAGLSGAWQRARRDPPRRWWIWAVPLVLAAAVAHVPLPAQRDRDRAHTEYLLGNLAGGEGRWSEAEAHFRSAVARRDDRADYWNNLGVALGQLGRSEEQLSAFRTAIEVDPACAEAHYNLGAALLEQGRADQALGPLEQAARLLPDDPRVASSLARARAAGAPVLPDPAPDP